MGAAHSTCLTAVPIVIHFEDVSGGTDAADVPIPQLLVQFTAGTFEILPAQFWLSGLVLEC